MLAIVRKQDNTVLNLYVLPKKPDGTSYLVSDITTTDDVEIRTVSDVTKVGDIV